MATDVTTAAAPTPAALRGGFWERGLAYTVDGFVLLIPNIIINNVIQSGSGAFGVNLLIGLAYFAYFWSSAGGGQTPGMRLFGLRVVRDDGSALSIATAVVRWVGLLVSFVALGIGVFWVAFNKEKKGWHDLMAGTIVVMEEPKPYPVQVTWEVPATNGRFWAIPVLGILARIVLLVPHLLLIYLVGIVVSLSFLVLWVPVISNGKYPAWGYRLVGGYLRWTTRMAAYFYGLTDRYPTPFDRNA